MSNLKFSRQREAIMSFLAKRKDHPTADVIYDNVRKEYPNISLGTVYRNLSLLAEMQSIKKLSCGDGKEHFDWDTSPHNHFVCRTCGSLLDIEYKSSPKTLQAASKNFKGKIEDSATMFYGTCEKCLKHA